MGQRDSVWIRIRGRLGFEAEPVLMHGLEAETIARFLFMPIFCSLSPNQSVDETICFVVHLICGLSEPQTVFLLLISTVGPWTLIWGPYVLKSCCHESLTSKARNLSIMVKQNEWKKSCGIRHSIYSNHLSMGTAFLCDFSYI